MVTFTDDERLQLWNCACGRVGLRYGTPCRGDDLNGASLRTRLHGPVRTAVAILGPERLQVPRRVLRREVQRLVVPVGSSPAGDHLVAEEMNTSSSRWSHG